MSLPAGHGPLLSGFTTPRESHSLTTSPIPTPNHTPSSNDTLLSLGPRPSRGPRKLSEIGEEESEDPRSPDPRFHPPPVIHEGRTRGERGREKNNRSHSREQDPRGTMTPPSRTRSRDDLYTEREIRPDSPLRATRTSPKGRRRSRNAPELIRDLKDLAGSEGKRGSGRPPVNQLRTLGSLDLESTLDHVPPATIKAVLSGDVPLPEVSVSSPSPDCQVPLHGRSSAKQILQAMEDTE